MYGGDINYSRLLRCGVEGSIATLYNTEYLRYESQSKSLAYIYTIVQFNSLIYFIVAGYTQRPTTK